MRHRRRSTSAQDTLAEDLFDPTLTRDRTGIFLVLGFIGAVVAHLALVPVARMSWGAEDIEPEQPPESEWVDFDFPEEEPPPPEPKPEPEPVVEAEEEVIEEIVEEEPEEIVEEEPEVIEEDEPEDEPEEEPEPVIAEAEPPEEVEEEVVPLFDMSEQSVSAAGAGPAVQVGSNRSGRAPSRARPSDQVPTTIEVPDDDDDNTSGPRRSGRPSRGRSDEVVDPSPRREVEADYPETARRRGVETNCTARVSIDEDGEVTSVRQVACDAEGWGFEEAAEAALEGFTFSPGTRNGDPEARRIRYTYRFRLD